MLILEKLKKYADYISNLNIVVFTPTDLEIIKGSPSIRRNLLNMTLSQISYSYLVTYNEYNKILKTRNEYLKILFTNGIADRDLFRCFNRSVSRESCFDLSREI